MSKSNVTVLGIASPEVKLARDLVSGKKLSGVKEYTYSDSLFICEGLWPVRKLIDRNIPVKYFYFCPEMIRTPEEQRAVDLMCDYAAVNYSISKKACEKISDRDGADGFFIIAEMPYYRLADLENYLDDDIVVMILDGQEQPGNIGAILRSLDCAGGKFAIMTNSRVRLTHPRLIRSSLGAAFMLPVAAATIEEALRWLEFHNFKILVTDLTAVQSYRDVDYSGRVAIVAGNEFKGIDRAWLDSPNSRPIIIPMLGSCESLNVGFASTLVAYEAGLRQKKL